MDYGKYKNRLIEYLQANGVSVPSNVDDNIHCINPDHDDSTESMHVYEDHVHCFGCQWNGDIYDVCGLFTGIIGKAEQYREIEKFFGDGHVRPIKKTTEKQTVKKKLPSVMPIPEEEGKSLYNFITGDFFRNKWGRVRKAYKYKNLKNEWQFVTVRFEKEKDDGSIVKNVLPFYYIGRHKWRSGQPPELDNRFLPYGIERTIGNDLPVLIVEGEKCGNCEVPGYAVVSWIGGTGQLRKTDWNVLRKKEVVVWPDNDDPGKKAAQSIKDILPHAKILDIKGKYPKGWDLADAIEEGFDPLEIIKDSVHPLADMKVDSYAAYKRFIEDVYPDESLEQMSGLYWQYSEEKHYWRRVERADIECNIQTWAAEKDLVELVEKKKIKLNTFLNEMSAYCRRHSTGYLKDAEPPLKKAAISPYLHFKNGCIQFLEDEDEPFQFYDREEEGELFFKKLYPINCIDLEFNPEVMRNFDLAESCPVFYYFLKSLIPPDIQFDDNEWIKTQAFFSQMLAYTLSPIKQDQYVFGFYGDEQTGKTFLSDIIKSLVGAEFVVERSSEHMESRFSAADLVKAKMYVDADVNKGRQLDDGFIKTYAGAREVTIENKHETPVHGVAISIAMYFITNFRFKPKGTEGMKRRLKIIPFFNHIEKKDKTLLAKITGKRQKGKEAGKYDGQKFDERPGLLAFALKGWALLLQNNFDMMEPDWISRSKEDWLDSVDSVRAFFNEHYFIRENCYEVEKRQDVYRKYTEYCKEENFKALGRTNFYEEARRVEGVKEGGRNGEMWTMSRGENSGDADPFK